MDLSENKKQESQVKANRASFINYLVERVLPDFFRSWQGIFSLVLIAPILILKPSALSIDRLPFLGLPLPELWRDTFIPGVIIVSVMLLRFHYDYRNAATRVENQISRVREVEQDADADLLFPIFFRAELRVVAERARLLMVKAESRANMLYGVGTVLTVISVFAPIASIVVYMNLEPLPPNIIDKLQSLRGANGELPEGLSLSIAKDWRVLLVGISFGFLFLAAAGALFSQHRRQMETSLRFGKEVDYFDGVVSAAEIRMGADEESLSKPMEKLVDDVVSELLTRPLVHDSTGTEVESTSTNIKQLSELLKQLRT